MGGRQDFEPHVEKQNGMGMSHALVYFAEYTGALGELAGIYRWCDGLAPSSGR